MEKEVWLPDQLRPYYQARIVLGLMVPKGVKVTAATYEGRYRKKLLDLLEADQDWLMSLETYMMAEDFVEQENKEAVLEVLWENHAQIPRPMWSMKRYLGKKMRLKELIQDLHPGEKNPEKSPISNKMFREDLEGLNLEEFLGSLPM